MPIGSGIVYNTGDLILSQVSSSGTAFLETKIAAATSSLIYFDSTARINSASLNSITVGTASYVSGSTSIITNLTASNISASGTGSFGIVGIGTVNPAYKLDVNGNANFTNGFYTNTDASSTSYFVGANGTRPIIFQNNTATSYDFGFKFTDSNTFTIVGGNTLANPTTDLVSFTYDGKVGIGTTGPSVRLHLVTGSIGGTAYPLYVDNNSGGAGVNVVGIGFANGGIMKHSITTAIYGNDYMAFNVGQGASYNQERMRIDSNGNVGIGTSIPSQKLHIKSTDTFAAIKFTNSVSDAGIISYSSDNLYFYTANAQRITIDTAGNVGIGTTTPTARLHVSGSTDGIFEVDTAGGVTSLYVSASGNVGIGTTNPTRLLQVNNDALIYANVAGAVTGSKLLFGSFANTTAASIYSQTTTATSGDLIFAPMSASILTEFVRIQSTGNVGIGTSSPSYLLDVYKTSNDSVIRSRTIGAGAYLYLDSATDGWYGINLLSGSTSRWFMGGYGTTSFTITRGIGATEYFRIDTAGNVGIGTTNPSSRLHISGSSSTAITITDDALYTNSITNDNSVMTYTVDTGNAAAGSAAHVFKRFNTELVRINASGNVGIGTSSPAQKLEVQSGSVLIRGDGNALFGTYYASAGENTFFTLHSGSGNTFHIGNDVAGTNYNTMVFTAATDTTGGKVGIGTSSPGSKLQINDNTPVLTIRTNDGGVSRKAYIDFYTTFFNFPSDVGARRTSTIVTGFDSGTWGTEFLAFNVGSGSTNDAALLPIERVRIDGSGNVGVGTSTIIGKLQVNSTSAPYYGPATSSATANGIFILGNTTADVVNTFGVDASATAYAWIQPRKTGTATYYSLALNPNGGNVGIGTTTPGALLELSSSTAASLLNIKGARGNNILYVSGSGNIGINSTAFDPLAPEALLISGSTYNIISADTNINTYGQVHTQNRNAGTAASSDLVATNDTGNEVGNYVDMGINSSGYTAGFIGNANDGYLYNTGSQFFIGNASPGRNLYFFAGSTTNTASMMLSASGNVGIGTTSPSFKLDVSGNARVGDSLYVTTATTSDASIEIGRGRSGNGNSYVDLIGDATYTDYGLRLIRSNGGANTTSAIAHRGTGTLYITAVEAAAISLETTNTTRMTITSGGNVGIGTTTIGAKLHVVDTTLYAPSLTWDSASAAIIRSENGQLAFGSDTTAPYPIWMQVRTISNTSRPMSLNPLGGNVGIGTTVPVAKLQVNGNISGSSFTSSISNAVGFLGTSSWAQNVVSASFATTAQTANALNTSNNYQVNSIGVGMAGSGTAGRIGLNEVGIRSWSITPTGGRLVIEAGDGLGSVIFSCPVTSSNFVGPGTGLTGTAASLTAGTANALNASNTYTVAGLTSAYVDVTGAGTIPTTGIYRPSTKTLGLSADSTLIFKISNVSSPATSSIETGNFIVQSGNVGIGTANATDKLTVYGALASYKNGADTIQTQVYLANAGNTRAFNVQLNSGGTGLDLWSYNSSNAWLKHTTFNYDGNVGIGTAAPAAKLEITGSSNSALLNIKSPISGAILYVSGSGAVGIGTSNVGAFTLQVNGSFGATTKSFIIDHPTKAGKKLMYGSLESPYHGIRLTGRDTLVNGKCKVELPDYIYKLILHDSVNIQLTGIKCNKTLYVDDINIPENYFTIAYDKAIFESYKDYDFFWDFTAIRADVPELTTEL